MVKYLDKYEVEQQFDTGDLLTLYLKDGSNRLKLYFSSESSKYVCRGFSLNNDNLVSRLQFSQDVYFSLIKLLADKGFLDKLSGGTNCPPKFEARAIHQGLVNHYRKDMPKEFISAYTKLIQHFGASEISRVEEEFIYGEKAVIPIAGGYSIELPKILEHSRIINGDVIADATSDFSDLENISQDLITATLDSFGDLVKQFELERVQCIFRIDVEEPKSKNLKLGYFNELIW